MNLPDRELLALNELCQALIDGALSDADRARLAQQLAGSEEARRFYVRTMALSASLFEYAGEMQSEAPEPRPIPASERPARGLWWAAGSLTAAAILMLGLWFGQHGAPRASEVAAGPIEGEISDVEDVVARLSASREVQWRGVAPTGEELHRGQLLQLVSGLAEIAFDSGAVVQLEGPATLQVTSAWEAVLRQGTLKAQVPKEAIGFRVSNPDVEVVDLGTEFSMVADAQSATEVFVQKGSVETRASEGSEPLVLREREARRFAKGKRTSEVADRDLKWRKLARLIALERPPQPLHFMHWSFDPKEDGRSGVNWAQPADRLGSAIVEAPSAPGRFGEAFSTMSYFGQLSLSEEVRQAPVQTAAFWLKVPAASELSDAGPILSWKLVGDGGARAEIAWNRLPGQGPLGALRTSASRGHLVGTSSVRDGEWHHIAVMFAPGRRNNERIQIRQYIDGRLDGFSSRRVAKRDHSEPVADDNSLWIGCRNSDATEHFRGGIDELYLIDRALSPQEIKHLMEKNELPAAASVVL